jgi:hypothetical protein
MNRHCISGCRQCLFARACRHSRNAERCARSSKESPRSSWSISRMLALHRSDCVGHPDEDAGVLEEKRGECSGLEAQHCLCLRVLEAFGQHRYERGVMPDAFGAMPDANREARSIIRTASRRVGSDAEIEPRDALREGRRAPPAPRDAPPVPRDAVPVSLGALPVSRGAVPVPRDASCTPGDAPCIRSDAVRKRGRQSRRVRRSSPIPREKERVPREAFGAQDDALRVRGDIESMRYVRGDATARDQNLLHGRVFAQDGQNHLPLPYVAWSLRPWARRVRSMS